MLLEDFHTLEIFKQLVPGITPSYTNKKQKQKLKKQFLFFLKKEGRENKEIEIKILFHFRIIYVARKKIRSNAILSPYYHLGRI